MSRLSGWGWHDRQGWLQECLASAAIAFGSAVANCWHAASRPGLDLTRTSSTIAKWPDPGPVWGVLEVACVVMLITWAALSLSIRHCPGLANPLVPLALAAIRKISVRAAVVLIGLQVLGAIVGTGLARAFCSAEQIWWGRGGGPVWGPGFAAGQVFWGEFLAAAGLIWLLFTLQQNSLIDEPNALPPTSATHPIFRWHQAASILLAATLWSGLQRLLLTGVSGGLAQPALALAAGVTGGFWRGLPLAMLAPSLGAFAAAVSHHVLYRLPPSDPTKDSTPECNPTLVGANPLEPKPHEPMANELIANEPILHETGTSQAVSSENRPAS